MFRLATNNLVPSFDNIMYFFLIMLFCFRRIFKMGSAEEVTKSIKLPATIDLALRNIKDAKVRNFTFLKTTLSKLIIS